MVLITSALVEKDKAKDRYNRNGGFSQKHLRIKADEKLRSNNKI